MSWVAGLVEGTAKALKVLVGRDRPQETEIKDAPSPKYFRLSRRRIMRSFGLRRTESRPGSETRVHHRPGGPTDTDR